MNNINYQIIQPNDHDNIELISKWYLSEWNIPIQTTINKITNLSIENNEFQILMTADSIPIATGGVHNHVGLLDKEPRLKNYKNWLALVYTMPEFRGKGLGALLCKYIQNHSKNIGLKNLYLFTHSAENLYIRLSWDQLERISLDGKDIVVMKIDL